MCLSCPIFNILSTDLSTRPIKVGVRWGTDLIPEQNCALKQVFSRGDSDQRRATFLLVGREHANIAMERLATYNWRAWHLIRTCEIASLQ
jgi:hypothetical protein